MFFFKYHEHFFRISYELLSRRIFFNNQTIANKPYLHLMILTNHDGHWNKNNDCIFDLLFLFFYFYYSIICKEINHTMFTIMVGNTVSASRAAIHSVAWRSARAASLVNHNRRIYKYGVWLDVNHSSQSCPSARISRSVRISTIANNCTSPPPPPTDHHHVAVVFCAPLRPARRKSAEFAAPVQLHSTASAAGPVPQRCHSGR